MTKQTAIKIAKWVGGLALAVGASYGIYLYYDFGKNKEAADAANMKEYTISLPFKYQNALAGIYEILLNYKYANAGHEVIHDALKNPQTIIISLMLLPEDVPKIKEFVESISPEIKLKEVVELGPVKIMQEPFKK